MVDQPSELLGLNDWLLANGYEENPFDEDCLNADKDKILIKNQNEINLDLTVKFQEILEGEESKNKEFQEFEKIIGNCREPGYVFTFAPNGGGKTASRLRIKSELNQRLGINPSNGRLERILVIEDIQHDIPFIAETLNTQVGHVNRIIRLIEDTLLSVDTIRHVNRALEELMSDCFDMNGLEQMIVRLQDIDWENIGGQTKENKIQQIILAYRRFRKLDKLLNYVVHDCDYQNGSFIKNCNSLDLPSVCLRKTIQKCRTYGLDGICLLVDNLSESQVPGTSPNIKHYEKIIAYLDNLLTECGLNTSAGMAGQSNFILKVFLPDYLEEYADRKWETISKLTKSPKIEWREENLRELLRRRLFACKTKTWREQNGANILLAFNDLCDDSLGMIVDKTMLRIGEENKGPRTMLLLAQNLIKDHCQIPRKANDKISLATYNQVRQNIQKDYPSIKWPAG